MLIWLLVTWTPNRAVVQTTTFLIHFLWTLTKHSLTSSSFHQIVTSELELSQKKTVDVFLNSNLPYYWSLDSNHPADERCTYLCGNSLGPLNKRSRDLLQEELHVWGTRYVPCGISLRTVNPLIILICSLTYFFRTHIFQNRRGTFCAPLWPRMEGHYRYSHPFPRRIGR